jgi:hypothetical protein
MTRKEANLTILILIADQVESNPDLRFNQILSNLKILVSKEIMDPRGETSTMYWEDRYYEDPQITLNRIKD